MRFTFHEPVLQALDDTFYCRSRRKHLNLETCLDDYMESNAMGRRRSACFRCPQGRRNRETYAATADEE